MKRLEVRLSMEAEGDLDGITAYTLRNWGWRQAERYVREIEEGLELIADHPEIGRSCNSIHAGLQRFEIGQHVAFYLKEPSHIFLVRLLHRQMLPAKYI